MRDRERDKAKRKAQALIVRSLLAVFALYVGFQLLAVTHRGYKTETAIQYSMTDSLYCDGFLDMEQIVVEGEGLLGYLVDSGERVSAGTAVAEKYTDETQVRSREELEAVEARISLLEKSQSNAADVDLLLGQMQNGFVDVLEELDRGSYGQLAETQNNYLLASNKFQYTTGKAKGFTEEIRELKQQRAALYGMLGEPERIYATTSGYFVDETHAQLLELETEELAEASPAQLQDWLAEAPVAHLENAAGKIVINEGWDFYGVCPIREAGRFDGVTQVYVSFPGYAEQRIRATVTEVTPNEEEGLAKVVLHSEYMDSCIPALAEGVVRIDFAAHQGIRLPAEALHIVDGAKGVYVKYGNIAYFRKIKILYQNEDFILVPGDGAVGTDNEVQLYDEIITEGSGLKNEKLL